MLRVWNENNNNNNSYNDNNDTNDINNISKKKRSNIRKYNKVCHNYGKF